MEQAAAGMVFVAYAAMLMIIIAPLLFYLLSLQKTLRLAGPANRSMKPGLVWLNLVPLLNLFWYPFTVLKVSEAIITILGRPRGDGGRLVGLASSLLIITCLTPLRSELLLLFTLAIWVVHWLLIGRYNLILQRIYAAQQEARQQPLQQAAATDSAAGQDHSTG